MQVNGHSSSDVISRLLSIDATAAETKNQIGVAIASKQLQAAKQQGQAIVNLIQQAGDAGSIDIQA